MRQFLSKQMHFLTQTAGRIKIKDYRSAEGAGAFGASMIFVKMPFGADGAQTGLGPCQLLTERHSTVLSVYI